MKFECYFICSPARIFSFSFDKFLKFFFITLTSRESWKILKANEIGLTNLALSKSTIISSFCFQVPTKFKKEASVVTELPYFVRIISKKILHASV